MTYILCLSDLLLVQSMRFFCCCLVRQSAFFVDNKSVGLVKMYNFVSNKLWKVSLWNFSSDFYQKEFLQILLFFILANVFSGGGYTAQLHFLFANFLYLQMYFRGVGILHSCIFCLLIFYACNYIFGGEYTAQLHFLYPGKESGIQLLIGLAPFSQIVGSLLRAPGLQSRLETLGKMWVWWIHFNGKIHATTFYKTHLTKSKIWQIMIQPFNQLFHSVFLFQKTTQSSSVCLNS